MMSSSFIADRARRLLRRFRRGDEGAILVEFALLIPMMLVVFAVIVEGSRLFWSFQSTIGGVRDAARYLARVAPSDICETGGSLSAHAARLSQIVGQSVGGSTVLPTGISVGAVTPGYECFIGDYRGGPAAVAQVSATLTVTYPFAPILALFGAELPTLTTIVTDQSRIYGA